MAQQKEQNPPETSLKEMEVSELPDKEFKITIKKMLNKLRKMMQEQNENINKEIENIKRARQNWRIL